MSAFRKYLLCITAFGGLCLMVYGWNATASRPSLEERFEPRAEGSAVSKEEQSGKYDFDTVHSAVGFRVRHLGLVDVHGYFRNFEGKIDFDAKNIKNSSVEFTAEMKSVDTAVNARDNHLRSQDFFDVMTFPEMSFKSTSIKKKGKQYLLTGDFTMKGVTKELKFPVRVYGPIKDERGTVRMGVAGSTTINRRTFNVNYGGNLPDGTAVLSDSIVVELQIESVKEKAEDNKTEEKK